MSWLSRGLRSIGRAFEGRGGAFLLGGMTGVVTYDMGKRAGRRAVRSRGYQPVVHGGCQRFLPGPTSMCCRSGVGAFAAMAGAAQTHGQLAMLANAARMTPAWHHPVGRANMAAILAANHARISFQNQCYAYAY